LINKIDLIGPEQYKTLFEEYEKSGIFKEIIGISALENKNVDTLVEKLKDSVEEGPMYFPADQVTDHPERFLVGEIIREKLLKYLEDEIPHGVAVEIEAYEEKANITNISAVIYCEKKSHKGMIIGKEGRKLKGVGKSAREDMEALLGTKVFLQLWVKVKENWRDSDTALSGFGYKE
jgi:GTP-binding protein Era